MHATDSTETHGTETQAAQTDDETPIWQQYIEQNSVRLADGLAVDTLAERFPVETYDDVDTLCRRALVEIPPGRSCYELADFEAAADRSGPNASQDNTTGASASRSVESDGGYEVVTGNGDDPLDGDASIDLGQNEQVAAVQGEIDRVQETVGGDGQ